MVQLGGLGFTAVITLFSLALGAGLRGEEGVTLRGRSIPMHRVFHAMVLMMVVLALFFAGVLALSVALPPACRLCPM